MKRTLQNRGLLRLLFGAALLFLLVEFSACTKNLNPNHVSIPGPADTTITDTTIYIDMTLNGTRILGVQNEAYNQWTWGALWGGPYTDDSIFLYNRLGATTTAINQTGLPLFALTIGNYNYPSQYYFDSTSHQHFLMLPLHAVDSFFTQPNYSYARLALDTTVSVIGDSITSFNPPVTRRLLTSGVSFLYIDTTGTQWETFLGSGDQTGSYFTITKNEPIANSTVTNYSNSTTITAIFDCMLYDGKGNSIHVTNGKLRQQILY
jgi:hypothetical protein